MTATGDQPKAGAATWYRSDQERNKSVRRRANPWYRRAGRGVVALCLLSLLGLGLYYGARQVQDYIEHDRLPSAGVEVPDIRSTSFQIRSSSPGPNVDGTLTLDTASLAFEFVGRNGGPQTGVQVISPTGSSFYTSVTDGGWQVAAPGDPLPGDLRTAARYLANDNTADAILTNRLRRGYVELAAQATEGVGDDELTRYELTLNTLDFSVAYPLQWQEYLNDAIPGVAKSASVPVIIWLDVDDVLVRVRNEQTNWSWERLTYSNSPFEPADPAATLLDATTDDETADDSDATTDG